MTFRFFPPSSRLSSCHRIPTLKVVSLQANFFDLTCASQLPNSFLYIPLSLKCFRFLPVRRGDVLAAWSGIRPLVTDPKSADTQSISRNHVVDVSDSGLITIAGMGELTHVWTVFSTLMNKCFVLFLLRGHFCIIGKWSIIIKIQNANLSAY